MAPSRNEREAREARERLRAYTARQEVHQAQRTRRRTDNIVAVIGVVVLVAAAAATQVFYFSAGPGAPKPTSSASASASAAGKNVGDIPKPSVAEARDWTGTLTLNEVPLGITLDGKAAPQAVSVFVKDVQNSYFLGKTCHRVVNSPSAALIQCGSEDGKGGSSSDFAFGPIENAPKDGVYPAGTIAMARQGDKAYSQGHQFFITTASTTLPDDSAGGYTVFGTVTSGLDRLTSDIVSKGTADGSADGTPAVATTITAVTVK